MVPAQKRLLWVFLSLLSVASLDQAVFVVAQTVNAGQVPGTVIKTLQIPVTPDLETEQRLKQKEVPIQRQQLIEPPTDSGDASLAEKFMVKDFILQGITLLPHAEIDSLLAPHRNQPMNLLELRTLADAITQLYRQKGYVTTWAYIPPQRIENGLVTLAAEEGRIGKIHYTSGFWFKRRAVATKFNLQKNQLLQIHAIEAGVRTVNQNPDLVAHVNLVPSEEPGKTDVHIGWKEQTPFHITPFYDNLGRQVIGRQRLGISASDNNVLGFADTSNTTVSWTHKSFGVVEQYQLPLNAHGTRLGFDYSDSQLSLGGPFAILHAKGRAHIYSPSISQRLFQTDHLLLTADVAFDLKNVSTDLLGMHHYNNDRIRELRPSLNLDWIDKTGRTAIRQEFGIGLPLLSGTSGFQPGASRLGGGTRFFRYTPSLTRMQMLPGNTMGVFRLMGQLTPDRLASIEQFQMGGAYTVRGYTEGIGLGDNALLASGEWRLPCYFIPKAWKIPRTHYGLRDNIQFVVFTDFGSVYLNKPLGTKQHAYLLASGIGIRAQITKFLSARIDMGVPFLRFAPDSRTPRLHFGLQSNLF